MSSKHLGIGLSDQFMSQFMSNASSKLSMQKDDYSYVFEPERIVDFGLEGMVKANKGLVLLEGHRILLRRDFRSLKQVKLLSGGCSGYEPMYTGFVGPGMLTGVVVGDKCAYPSYPTILLAIRELAYNNDNGVLIILENILGCKINFGLAAEHAQREGILVKVILVKDDTSCPNTPRIGRKGLAGVAFIFKVAAAMAEYGKCIEEIYDTCEKISCGDLSTISISIFKEKSEFDFPSADDDTNSFGCPSSSSMRATLVKKGIEIMGDININETLGVYPFTNKQEFANLVLKYIISSSRKDSSSNFALVLEPHEPIAVLFNNYGYIMNLEMNAIVREICNELKRRRILIERIYVGTVMMSRCHCGFSISAMRVNDTVLKLLDHPTNVSGWPTMISSNGTDVRPSIRCQSRFFECSEVEEIGPMVSDIARAQIGRILEFVNMSLISCEEQINRISTDNQTGLYGTFIKNGVEKINLALYENRLNLKNPFAFLKQMSILCSTEMAATCGSFYGVFFNGASQVFIKYLRETDVTANMWVEALEKGIQAIEHFGDIRRKERTLLDALCPMLEVLKRNPDALEEAAEAAEMGSLSTINQCKKHTVPAVGAHIVAIWARAFAEGMQSIYYKSNGHQIYSSDSGEPDVSSEDNIDSDELLFGYI